MHERLHVSSHFVLDTRYQYLFIAHYVREFKELFNFNINNKMLLKFPDSLIPF